LDDETGKNFPSFVPEIVGATVNADGAVV